MNQSGLPTPPPQAGPSSSSNLPEPSLSLDNLLQQISTTNSINSLNSTLRSFSSRDVRETILAGPLTAGQDPLTVLDVRTNTLAVLLVLSARLNSPTAPVPPLDVICDFCRDFTPEQARFAPDRVTILAKGIMHLAGSIGSPKWAVDPLYNLVTRYPPSPDHLTTIHPIFLATCVSTRHFAPALDVLSTSISLFDTVLSDLTYNDNLVYHYTGGIVFAALKKWTLAEEFFEICVSSPGQGPAAIQLEALKKLVLVQLISKGKTTPPPKYTHPILLRLLKSTPYNSLMTMYPQQPVKLRDLVDKERQLFSTERNLGLINQALDRAPRWSIKKLTATYLTLSFSEIGQAVQISDESTVHALVLSMIESSEISAQISAVGTVTFSDPPPQFTKADVDRVLREAQEQSALLERLEMEMTRSREYLTKAVRSKEEAWGASADEELYAGASLLGGVSFTEE